MIPPPPSKRHYSPTSVELFRPSSWRCKTYGSARKQGRFKVTLTDMTPRDSSMTLYSPQFTGTLSLLNADITTLITEKDKILEGWAELFESMPNRQSITNDEAIDHLNQADIKCKMDSPPKEDKVKEAIGHLSNGKVPGADAIPAEVYKASGYPIFSKLTELFQSFWGKGQIPNELKTHPSYTCIKDTSIIYLYKRKGKCQACDNHGDISLLPIAGTILARVLLNQLNAHLEQERKTVDMFFTAHQLQAKCQEQNRQPYTMFMRISKAFNTVSQEGLWKTKMKFGCPDRLITMVRQFHDRMAASVLDDGDCSDVFPISKGINKAVYWHLPSSVWVSLPCWLMLSRAMIMESTSTIEQMESYSTWTGFRPSPRLKRLYWETSCLLMTVLQCRLWASDACGHGQVCHYMWQPWPH